MLSMLAVAEASAPAALGDREKMTMERKRATALDFEHQEVRQ